MRWRQVTRLVAGEQLDLGHAVLPEPVVFTARTRGWEKTENSANLYGTNRHMSFLRTLGLLLLATASLPAQRVVYLLAGQSNIANLNLGAPDASLTRANVTYFDFGHPLGSPTAAAPTMEIGHQLGQLHSGWQVDVVQIAVSGSALLKQNNAGFGYWLPAADPMSILSGYQPILSNWPSTQLLRIVWSQGETDMLHGISQDEYAGNVQLVFGALSGFFPTVPVEVYLAVPGALDPTPCAAVQNQAADSVRDAYNWLHDQATPPFPTRIVAHHYDLPHAVAKCNNVYVPDVHLSFDGYLEFGHRIGYGIVNPSSYFDVTGSTFSASTIDLTLSDVAVAPPATANNMFVTSITSGSTVTQVLPTSATLLSPTVLRLAYTGVNFLTVQHIEVRYVAGAGVAATWQAQAVHSYKTLPLASRLIIVL